MEVIESAANRRIKEWAKLQKKKERDRTGRFLAEGEHLTEEAIAAGLAEVILTDHPEDYEFEPKIQVPFFILEKLSSSVSGVHTIAVCRMKEEETSPAEKILVLDGVQDPGNLGTLIRTALSFGYERIVCSPDTVDLYNDKVLRSTQGSLFHISVIRTELVPYLRRLKDEGMPVLATSLHKAAALQSYTYRGPHALILGNEGNGVSDAVLAESDVCLKIEMDRFESLNVAAAGAILMYELHGYGKS